MRHLTLAGAPAELAEAEVAGCDERAHAEFFGQARACTRTGALCVDFVDSGLEASSEGLAMLKRQINQRHVLDSGWRLSAPV
jgi:hypothetical protein